MIFGTDNKLLLSLTFLIPILGLGIALIAPSFLIDSDVKLNGINQGIVGQLEIAVREYKKKTGQYPVDLSALVPKYIEAIPFTTCGGSFQVVESETANNFSVTYKLCGKSGG